MLTTAGAITFGVALGLLVASVLMLGTLARYVSSDLDGFRRWLDKGGVL
jgi:hypothetical protein